jgi:hypothetical protein
MKTKVSILFLSAIITISLTNCKKKAGPLSCLSDTVQYSEDFSTFYNNQSKGNCLAVKKSIEKLYKSCTTLATGDKESYEEFQNEFNCDDFQ